MHDFADIHADDKGFVLLGTRDAEGGGTLNCGNPSNMCGTAPDPAVPCYDMYLARFDGSSETWATKLTSSSASLPPISATSCRTRTRRAKSTGRQSAMAKVTMPTCI
ncbi:unnamed protein product [Hyaloperonospora brassicae]|uniref:Uncharacterized protein n=1 Tax=Hyaloperonospora brassicae TaxID=162125 RepID=A0AAV0ULA8_HYABA|nr:unnamed protein product [Hyaloperonospora brassicae]